MQKKPLADIPNTHRFFVPPGLLHGDEVHLTDRTLVHQMERVLRLRPGERVLLLDGMGTGYEVQLTEVGHGKVSGHIEQRGPAHGEPAITLTLYVALLRGERFEWVLQKGTELGATRFVPVRFAHSQAAAQATAQKQARWQRIVREAAEQSCRGILPDLAEPQSLEAACQSATSSETLALILWEGDNTPSLRQVVQARRQALVQAVVPGTGPGAGLSLAVFSGPEGGIAPEELTTTTEHGIIPVSLGNRILRAETAPVAAAAAIFYEFDW
jgi:16S rRNA (uracil1498-N3)-methyltransferase